MSPMFQPSLVDIWADTADPTPLSRPAAGADVSADVGRMSLPYASASVDTRRPESAVAGPCLLEPATSVFAGAPLAAVAQPTRLDAAYARAYGMTSLGIRPTIVGVPRPLDVTLSVASDDVAQPHAPLSMPTASDDVYTLPSGNVGVAGPAYDPTPPTVIDIACASSPSSVLVLALIGLCPLWACVNLSHRCRWMWLRLCLARLCL